MGIGVITETGSFSHSSPSTGSIRLKAAVTGSHFFSISGSDGTSIKIRIVHRSVQPSSVDLLVFQIQDTYIHRIFGHLKVSQRTLVAFYGRVALD